MKKNVTGDLTVKIITTDSLVVCQSTCDVSTASSTVSCTNGGGFISVKGGKGSFSVYVLRLVYYRVTGPRACLDCHIGAFSCTLKGAKGHINLNPLKVL